MWNEQGHHRIKRHIKAARKEQRKGWEWELPKGQRKGREEWTASLVGRKEKREAKP
jgi:hypothetical protein